MAGDAPFPQDDTSIEAQAAAWIARRDRGLTAAEQDEYLHWLAAHAGHRRAVAQLEKAWALLDGLAEWRPEHSAQPNPDLLVQPPARRKILSFPVVFTVLGVAATLVFAVLALQRSQPAVSPERNVAQAAEPQRLRLDDGSVVTLNQGGNVVAAFTPGERRVRLVAGEAHFSVAKNPARPFVVEAGAVSVRAVGTAFTVRRAATAVEVLVTEGKVQVEHPAAPAAPLERGERAVVELGSGAAVRTVPTESEVDRTLAWQHGMLNFVDLPLRDVVASFNERNARQMRIADDDTGRVLVGGKFRADNLEGFVRLLKTWDIAATSSPDGTIVLRQAK